MKKQPRHQKGFSLVEILVTLVVLSIGLLGLAALQMVGLRSANSSGYRGMAVMLASDLADRMNANPAAVNFNGADITGDGIIDNTGPFVNFNSAILNCAIPPAPYCSDFFDGAADQVATACTPAQMGTFDLNVTFCGDMAGGGRAGGISNLLPGGALTVICNDGVNCANGATHTITVFWSEVQNQGAAAQKSFSMTFIPRARI